MKNDLLVACRQCKPNDFYISENLIPKRNNIMYRLRQAKKRYPHIVSGCSTKDMRVYAWIKPSDPHATNARNSRMAMNTLQKWEKFCRDVLKTEPGSFLNNSSLSTSTSYSMNQSVNEQ